MLIRSYDLTGGDNIPTITPNPLIEGGFLISAAVCIIRTVITNPYPHIIIGINNYTGYNYLTTTVLIDSVISLTSPAGWTGRLQFQPNANILAQGWLQGGTDLKLLLYFESL